ncbi:hypothetical protein GMMP1_300023 [Candidatus Magnetomoraceae bacterium gMMP-1]
MKDFIFKFIILISLIIMVSCVKSRTIDYNASQKAVSSQKRLPIITKSIELLNTKGNLENPYSDYNEAAKDMSAKLSAILKNMIQDDDSIQVIVGKTDVTPSNIALSFSEAISSYGIEQIVPKKWLPVVIDFQDLFDIDDTYKNKQNESFETANVLLALHKEKRSEKIFLLRAHIFVLRSITIVKDGKSKRLSAGMVIPYCVSSAYVVDTFDHKKPIDLKEDTVIKSFYDEYEEMFSKKYTLDLSFKVSVEYTEIIVNNFGSNDLIHFRIEQVFPDGKINILYPTDFAEGIMNIKKPKKKLYSVVKDDTIKGKVYVIAGVQTTHNDKAHAVTYAKTGQPLTLSEYKKEFHNTYQWEVFSE